MTQRYFLSRPINATSKNAVLDGDEARHLSKVMRKKVGEEVLLFDGTGYEYRAVIDALFRDEVELSILESIRTEPENSFEIILAAALPKGDRQKWMIEKLTELGCTRFIPLKTDRGVAQCDCAVEDRLRRIVVEASKQCGRSTLMRISEEMTIERLSDQVDTNPNDSGKTIRWIAHPDSGNDNPIMNPISDSCRCCVLVGPEGGFTAAELDTAQARNWKPVGLGSNILRIETAAIAFCSILLGWRHIANVDADSVRS